MKGLKIMLLYDSQKTGDDGYTIVDDIRQNQKYKLHACIFAPLLLLYMIHTQWNNKHCNRKAFCT